ncbi:unnamed protein product [Phaedon cochleariae]|uniref:Spaetzle domain-containing protein n=1 Tax=Phaedon cochleariae TaxID=80249 RepID=A0A9P0DBR1_PHACE|nr:unnamed protein product [Phaedon cochleariae]
MNSRFGQSSTKIRQEFEQVQGEQLDKILWWLFFVLSAALQGRYISEKMRQVKTTLTPIYHEIYQNCRHQICPYPEGYPEREIMQAMTRKESLVGMFGIILNSTFDATIFENRSGAREITRSLCSTEGPATYQPRVMRNLNGQWRYVINVGEFQQTFSSEFCRKFDSRRNFRDEYCNEFEAGCDQDFQEMFLLTYENGVIDFDKFMIPTTCNCMCNL